MSSVRNDTTSIENLPGEQSFDLNNDQDENSIPNESNSERIVSTIKIAKKGPMTPTPLYVFSLFFLNNDKISFVFLREYSCWSTHRTATTVCRSVLFILLAITVGVLTIYFTSPKVKSMF